MNYLVDFNESVPEYEVVNIRSRMTRDLEGVDIRHVDLTAFGSRFVKKKRNSKKFENFFEKRSHQS